MSISEIQLYIMKTTTQTEINDNTLTLLIRRVSHYTFSLYKYEWLVSTVYVDIRIHTPCLN